MKILIVEDQATSALFLHRTLERLGHEPIVASDGIEAWRIVRDEPVPVVITDWVMPGLDGPELCRLIRAREGGRYTYVILLTSKDRRQDRLEGLRAGADDYLVKPPDVEELRIRLGIAARFLALQEELEEKNRLLSELAMSDGLTGLKNRRYLEESIDAAFSFATRHGHPLSFILLDVDHFKQYNDAFGHPAGDEVLRNVAWTLRSSVREHDTVARYGGEEFAILLPATNADEALLLAERLRATIEKGPWDSRQITASFGVSTFDGQQTCSSDALLELADQALYYSKRTGRNRVTHGRTLSPAVPEEAPEPSPDSSLDGRSS